MKFPVFLRTFDKFVFSLRERERETVACSFVFDGFQRREILHTNGNTKHRRQFLPINKIKELRLRIRGNNRGDGRIDVIFCKFDEALVNLICILRCQCLHRINWTVRTTSCIRFDGISVLLINKLASLHRSSLSSSILRKSFLFQSNAMKFYIRTNNSKMEDLYIYI